MYQQSFSMLAGFLGNVRLPGRRQLRGSLSLWVSHWSSDPKGHTVPCFLRKAAWGACRQLRLPSSSPPMLLGAERSGAAAAKPLGLEWSNRIGRPVFVRPKHETNTKPESQPRRGNTQIILAVIRVVGPLLAVSEIRTDRMQNEWGACSSRSCSCLVNCIILFYIYVYIICIYVFPYIFVYTHMHMYTWTT